MTPLAYPLHDWTGTITHCGRICYKSRKVNLSQVFAGQEVGVKQVDDDLWLVTFMDYDLGYFDDETCRPGHEFGRPAPFELAHLEALPGLLDVTAHGCSARRT